MIRLFRLKPLRLFALGAATFVAAAHFASGVVTVVWTEDSFGVTASYSGSIDLSSFGTGFTSQPWVEPEGAVRNNRSFAFYDGSVLIRYDSAGTTPEAYRAPGTGGIVGSGMGDPFSFSNDSIFFAGDYMSGQSLAGSAFFSGETLASMFPDDLPTLIGQDTDVWLSNDGSESVIYRVIPEPGTLFLVVLGGCGLVVRRRGG